MDINVGIFSRERIEAVFHGEFTDNRGSSVSGETIITHPDVYTPASADSYFELKDVTIGIQFHWQRNEKQSFKGSLSIILDENGLLTAVNTLDIEEYLCSVISSEMSGTSLLELLKAHAVISRSWAMRKILERRKLQSEHCNSCNPNVSTDSEGRHIAWYGAQPHTLFDVCADDHCQRYYGNTRASDPKVAEAVKATAGMVLMHNGEICDCRYHKCCGGRTERYDVCWEDKDIPYLKSVEDDYCGRASDTVLRQMLNDYDFATKDYHDWCVNYSAEELSNIIRERSGIDFGDIINLEPLKRGDSGRIYELRITGSKRTMVIGKELEIRKWLSKSHLYSSAFDVTRTPDGGFSLQGKGWGHGVGLCQIGAAVMATEGKNYLDILSYYYYEKEIRLGMGADTLFC